MKERKKTLTIILLTLIGVLTIMSLTSCGTTGKTYNVGTGELIPKK